MDMIVYCADETVECVSGLSCTQFLAEAIAKACSASVQVREDSRLRERNYGEWQGLTWDEAYASDPKNFHGLITIARTKDCRI